MKIRKKKETEKKKKIYCCFDLGVQSEIIVLLSLRSDLMPYRPID